MRISDWSSDVCSSDLPPCRDHRDARREGLERPVHPDMTAQPAAIDPPSADWHERAERIAFDGRPFVDGAARTPCSRATTETECPFTEKPMAATTDCAPGTVDRTVAAAWRWLTGLSRGRAAGSRHTVSPRRRRDGGDGRG